VPPADAPRPAVPSSRSPRLARTVLLGACAAGLVGLAVPHAPTGTPGTTAAVRAASSTLVAEPRLDLKTSHPVVARRATPPRASRLRSLPAPPLVARWVRPCSAGVVSDYGMRWGQMHKGVDFGASYGAPIRAIGDGVVVGAGYQSDEAGYGQITLIRHANGMVSAYAHQSRMLVGAGDHVTAGQVIGYVGTTGHVTGPHLHFEIRTQTHGGQIDPLPWLRAQGVSV
jgi:murein DD-endopeptidase MepM/ murein hydrolase activator NlpD